MQYAVFSMQFSTSFVHQYLLILTLLPRKNHARAMDSMQASLESEQRAKAEALRIKKKLEGDINELEIALDHANKANSEAQKSIKRYQVQKVFYFFLNFLEKYGASHKVCISCRHLYSTRTLYSLHILYVIAFILNGICKHLKHSTKLRKKPEVIELTWKPKHMVPFFLQAAGKYLFCGRVLAFCRPFFISSFHGPPPPPPPPPPY